MSPFGQSDFRPIFNPYIVGNPIKDPKMFFGREDDFAYVQKKFSGGKEGGIIVLCGARRSGKTSVLFQVLNGRLGEDFLPVLIDMQSMAIRDDKDFLGKLAQEIVAAVKRPDVTVEEFFSTVADNPFTAFDNLIKRIGAVVSNKKLVLLFDEYELFETNIDSGVLSAKVLNLLANLVEHKRVFVVFTGSDNLKARDKPYWEIFLGKSLHRRITFLSRDDTIRLVRKPVDGIVRYDAGIPEEIFALTAGQPFYTQVLCQTIVDHLNEYRRYDVSLGDVQKVIDEIIQNPLPQMIFNWNALGDLEKLGLAIMAEISRDERKPVSPKDILAYAEREKIGYRIDSNELNKALESLFHGDLLNKEAGTDAYSFKMDLWRMWVGRMHSVWQVIDEMERSEKGSPGKGIFSELQEKKRKRRVITFSALFAAVALVAVYWFVVAPNMRSKISSPDLATLTVRTNPPRATVFVDDSPIGVSPIVGARVPAARKALRIELAGYRVLADTLRLKKNESKELSYDLAEATGYLIVRSTPPGASITIDGKNTQLRTPETVRGLSANRLHRVEVSLAGYQVGIRDNVRIAPDSTVSIDIPFGKLFGALGIASQPAEADARVDGTPYGKTPCLANNLAYGTHRLEITKAGYRDYASDIEISKPEARIEVPLTLLPTGKLILRMEPYAWVSINGKLLEEDLTYRELELAPGKYTILLKHPRSQDVQTEVEVKSNESVTVYHKFTE